MLGGEPLVVGTGGLGGEVDPKAIDSLRDLCTTSPNESPFVGGGAGEDSLDLLGGLSPPLLLGAGVTGAEGNDGTLGKLHGDACDANDHTLAPLAVGPDAQGDSLGLPSPSKGGRADPGSGAGFGDVGLLLGDLSSLLENGISDDGNGVVGTPSPENGPEGGTTPGTDSADRPPPPPLDDEPAGGTAPNNDKARQGKGGKNRKARGFTKRGKRAAQTQTDSSSRKKPTLAVPRKSPRAFPSNPRAYWNAPISTIKSVPKRQDEVEAMVKRHAEQLKLYAEQAALFAQQFSDAEPDLIAKERRKIETVDGTWWAPGVPVENPSIKE